MASILTNSSAMVALETLRGINKNLGQVQSEISTGKRVSNAKDNAAIYAISTVMSSDVSSFDKISDSLNLGSATVGVARAASEQVVDILTEMKGLIVSAQEDNVDRSKIQTDVSALRDQITTIVGAAQFNGLNLVSGTDSINVLASLDRASDNTVSASNISVSRNDLTQTAGVTGVDAVAAVAAADKSSGTAGFLSSDVATVDDGGDAVITFEAGAVVTGETFTISFNGSDYEYTAVADDTASEVIGGLKTLIDADISGGDYSTATSIGADLAADDSTLTISNVSVGDGTTVSAISQTAAVAEVTAVTAVTAGGLAALADVDVSDSTGATSALGAIDALLTSAIDAAASFGSSQKRIDTQDTFVNSLMDSMKVGIGALVDADLEEASARLQSLQVQQQLGVQALSIANQAPQSLLSLFR